MLFFLREATSETYGPQVLFLIICLCDLFLFAFIFRSINPKKYKNTLLHFILFVIYLFNLLQLYPISFPLSGAVTQKGLTTPLSCRVASGCYLCAGVVYVVLLGSPTGSITLVSSLREIPTVDVLHRPFLFWEIPT